MRTCSPSTSHESGRGRRSSERRSPSTTTRLRAISRVARHRAAPAPPPRCRSAATISPRLTPSRASRCCRPARSSSRVFRSSRRCTSRRWGFQSCRGATSGESDVREAPPVVMVNETLARKQWPGQDPIGRRLRMGRTRRSLDDRRRARSRHPASRPGGPAAAGDLSAVHAELVHVDGIRGAHGRRSRDDRAALRAAVTRLDPAQPISRVSTMDEHLARSLSRPHFMSTLTAAFGGLALLLVVGIYGVMAYAVAQRTREIAIRSALGARRAGRAQAGAGQALWLSVAGVRRGSPRQPALSRVLSGQLFGIEPRTRSPTPQWSGCLLRPSRSPPRRCRPGARPGLPGPQVLR